MFWCHKFLMPITIKNSINLEQATKATREFCKVYSKKPMLVKTTQYWFKQFKDINFDIKNVVCFRRPVEFDEKRLN